MAGERVQIYTDGACSGNPGPGGWAAVLLYRGHVKELSGFEPETTNQRMELRAAVEGLAALKRPCQVYLYSDSAYLVNAFQQGWIKRWQQNGWRNARKEPVENQDLWRRLLELARRHRVRWLKVPGHAQVRWNERCDELARAAIREAARARPGTGEEAPPAGD